MLMSLLVSLDPLESAASSPALPSARHAKQNRHKGTGGQASLAFGGAVGICAVDGAAAACRVLRSRGNKE